MEVTTLVMAPLVDIKKLFYRFGENVYGTLKYEKVCIAQRVPETETQGRVHTLLPPLEAFFLKADE